MVKNQEKQPLIVVDPDAVSDERTGSNGSAGNANNHDESNEKYQDLEYGGERNTALLSGQSTQSSVISYCTERNRTKHNSMRAATEIHGYESSVSAAAEKVKSRKVPCFVFTTRRHRLNGLNGYYQTQLELLSDYDEDTRLLEDTEHGITALEALDATVLKQRKMDSLLAQLTFWLNVLLLTAKIVASVLSNSLSVISTVIDSIVDLVSGATVWITVRAIRSHNPYEYPRGRNKLEPLSVVIVGIVMGAANCVMIVLSVQNILDGKVDPHVDIPTVAILLTGTLVKVFLLVACLRQKTPGSIVLAMDQRNDIITNLVALACGFIGTKWWLFADPIGAILVCTYIALSWFVTAAGQVPLLSGKAAPARYTSRILHLVINHDERINAVDALYVYHHGIHFLVEAHVVLHSKMSLKESHDITEPLQIKLEKLPYVERAFLHCDYRLDGIK